MNSEDFGGNVDFCKCENRSGVYSETGTLGCWLVCRGCNKVIEDSYAYFNLYEGNTYGSGNRPIR